VVKGPPDTTYMLVLIGLLSVGLIMVYSTTAFEGGTDNFTKQLMWLGLGVVGLLVAAITPIKWWRAAAPWLLGLCAIALFSLLFKEKNPLAIEANGAYRWLKVPGGQVQPSEFAKLAFVLVAAQYLEVRGQRLNLNHWATFLVLLGGLAGMIYLEPDLGTALVLAGTAFCMLIAAGAKGKVLFQGVLVAAVLVALLAWNTDHQRDRLLAWWNPWKEEYRQTTGYQVLQSWSAMSRGGVLGVGLGKSIHKIDNRLPEAETDFVFAIVAEEMGLLRAVGVLLLFGLLAWRGYAIAARAPDRFTFLVAAGLTSWIAVQSCLNIAVVTGTVPNTGVPLPFISKGGSSLIALLAAVGLVINISRTRRASKKEAPR